MTDVAQSEKMNWPVLAAVGTGTFMSALDGSVANTVLPVLSRSLHSTVVATEWVVTVYLLVTSALVLSAGRWGDLHGQRPIYLSGFVVFITSSVLCGIAPNMPLLIAARGLQALGATCLFASSPAIVTLNFPSARRGQALGVQATLTYLGITAGPLLGGWLASQFGWRSVFYINVPVGLLALWLSRRFIPADKPRTSSAAFDMVGASLFAVALVSLMVALNQGHHWGWLSVPTLILGLLAIGLFVGFIRWEKRVTSPMLDLRLFRDRSFSAASVSALLNFFCLNGLLFLMPFYLIEARGLTTAHAGLIISALPLAMAIVAPWSGAVSDRIGATLPSTIGMALMAVAIFLLSRLAPNVAYYHVAATLALAGVGVGLFLSPNNSALMGSAPRDQQGVAGAVRATSRNLGNVLGIGIVGAVFNSVLAHHAAGSAVFSAFHTGLLTITGAAVLGAVSSGARGHSGAHQNSR